MFRRTISIITREGLTGLAAELFRSWLWPAILAGVGAGLTMLSTIITPLPLPFLFAAAALVFCAILGAALLISLLRERMRVRDRLYFSNGWFAPMIEVRDGQAVLAAAQLGFVFENLAPFPMHFRVANVRSSFAGRIEPNPTDGLWEGKAITGRPYIYRDAQIPLAEGFSVKPGEVFGGTLYFKVEYGATSNYGHSMEHDILFYIVADTESPTKFTFSTTYKGSSSGVSS